MESLHNMNLQNKDAIWFYRDKIFPRVREELNVSLQVKDTFKLCASETNQEGKDVILNYILDKYRNLQAKDFVGFL